MRIPVLLLAGLLAGCPAPAAVVGAPDGAAVSPPPTPAEPETPTAQVSPTLAPRWLDVTNPVPGLSLGTLEHAGQRFHVARLDLGQVRLELDGQGADWTGPRTFSHVAERLQALDRQLVWGTNAGIFHEGGRPAGLHVQDGVVTHPLTAADGSGNFYLKPNGAFLVGETGARIRETSELADDLGAPRLASQSGPLILRAGALHPALRADSPNRLLRSGVGVQDEQTVWFAMSQGSVRFHELATLFRDRLGCVDALYLDGVISQWVTPDLPPGPTDGALGGLFYVAR